MNKVRLFNSNHRMKRILQYLLLISVVLYLTISCQKEKEEDLLPLAALVAGRSTSTTATNGGTTTFTLGGTVSGLSGTVVLTNGGVDKSVTANGAYTFDSSVNSGSTYNVTIKTQPTGQVCSVSNGTGTANANVSNIDMSCCTIKGGASKCAISLTGIVTTLAGGTTSGSDDGTGTSARFSSPIGITSDGTNLYVTESANHRIRKIVIATGVVSTLAGSTQGFNNATGTAAQFNIPEGITSDGTNLYVSDSNNQIIRKIVIASGVVSTLAGTAGSSGYTDDTGTAARFYNPRGITTDGTNLYVVDANNQIIRKIVIASGVVSTLAGTAGSTGSTDDTGTAARFNEPRGITTDGTNLYVADYINNRIRKVVIATGVVTTLAGSGAGSFKDDTGTSAEFRFPYSITTDGTNLYVADQFNHRIRKIVIATAVVTTLAGSTQGFIDSTGTSAQFKQPRGITTDGVNLYVADTSNNSIRKIE